MRASRTRRVAMLLGVALGVGACGAEPEDADVPPPIPAEAITTVAEPGAAEFEQVYPITAEDVGDLVIASGFVVGNPGPEGFFLQTEGGQVILVRSPQPAMVGQAVRAVGPVRAAEVARFQGWQRELLGEPEPDWELIPVYYIEATRVVSVAGP